MSASDVERYMGSTLAAIGFDLDETDADVVYGDRPAWAVFYRGPDCKLQCAVVSGGRSRLYARSAKHAERVRTRR